MTIRWYVTRSLATSAIVGDVVATAAGVNEAVELANQDPPASAVVDLRMGDGSGLDLVRKLKEIAPQTRSVILTAYGSIVSAVEALRLGAVDSICRSRPTQRRFGRARAR